jgi:hypothetical protein
VYCGDNNWKGKGERVGFGEWEVWGVNILEWNGSRKRVVVIIVRMEWD